ncbi:MAG TPA: hypothetical protein VK187_07275 [Geobacteraceae bacterium]|nr:hypothetical protein [Geobacteraceae bacterium]
MADGHNNTSICNSSGKTLQSPTDPSSPGSSPNEKSTAGYVAGMEISQLSLKEHIRIDPDWIIERKW